MTLPYLGHGVGLRVPHYERALRGGLEVDWVEVISENFFGGGGRPRAVLEAVRRERPLVFHGVSLGVGSLGPPPPGYLRRLRALVSDFEPAWVSDHICWTRLDGRESHELLPLPFTEEALAVTVENTLRAQDALGRPLVLENVSSYVRYAASQLCEWEFSAELTRRSGCFLLLDLNNVVVSAHNHGFSPEEYLGGLPADRVVQLHLANHSQRASHKFDDHRGPVPEVVWALYEAALRRFGPVSSLVEWDEALPSWERLVAERDQAERRACAVLSPREALAARAARAAVEVSTSRAAPATREGPAALAAPPPLASQAAPQASQPASAAREGQTEPPGALAAAQRLFFAALTWPRGATDFAGRETHARRELGRVFGEAGGDAPLEGLEIYADAYFYRQLDALRATFPRLARLSGDVAFHDLITDYVLQRPSDDPDLHRRGDRLPAFLLEHALGRERPLLAELAALELALARALDAPDAPSLTRPELARRAPEDWPGLELALVPSAALVRAALDLGPLAQGGDAAELERAFAASRPGAAPVTHLVFRREQRARCRALEPLEALALELVASGTRFEALCERVGARGAAPATVLGWLERWLDDALLRGPARRASP